MQKVRLEMYVYGIVQGVGFRYFVKRNATLLNISGYVENLSDGRVHIMCEGEKTVLDRFVEVVRTGNSYSEVENVECVYSSDTREFQGFEIL
ncbi:MAG: acylphosphatase [Caldisericaceae bacterium]